MFWLVVSGLGAVADGTTGASANSSGFLTLADLRGLLTLGWFGRCPPHVMLQPACQAPTPQWVCLAPTPQPARQAPTPLLGHRASTRQPACPVPMPQPAGSSVLPRWYAGWRPRGRGTVKHAPALPLWRSMAAGCPSLRTPVTIITRS